MDPFSFALLLKGGVLLLKGGAHLLEWAAGVAGTAFVAKVTVDSWEAHKGQVARGRFAAR